MIQNNARPKSMTAVQIRNAPLSTGAMGGGIRLESCDVAAPPRIACFPRYLITSFVYKDFENGMDFLVFDSGCFVEFRIYHGQCLWNNFV